MRKGPLILIIIILVVLGIVIFGKGKDTDSELNSSQTTIDSNLPPRNDTVVQQEEANQTESSTTTSDLKVFTVEAKNYSFIPATITVKKGDKVKITLTGAEGLHDFKIDEFNVATKRITGGQTDSVEFTADKTGTFEYYCSVGNHRAMGMVGKITVE